MSSTIPLRICPIAPVSRNPKMQISGFPSVWKMPAGNTYAGPSSSSPIRTKCHPCCSTSESSFTSQSSSGFVLTMLHDPLIDFCSVDSAHTEFVLYVTHSTPRCFFTKSTVSCVHSSPRGMPAWTSHSIFRPSIFSLRALPNRGWWMPIPWLVIGVSSLLA